MTRGEIPIGRHSCFDANCAAKNTFPNAKEARRWAKHATAKYNRKFKSYRCGLCGQYHLTTKG